MHFVVIGTPGDRRVDLFQEALRTSQLPPARTVSYADLLGRSVHLAQVVQDGSIVRLESPGRDFEVERLLLAAGASQAESEPVAHISAADAAALPFDKGRIWFPRQWYLGFCAALDVIASQLAECPPHRLMNAPGEIALMFDKPACHALFATHALPVPRSLGPASSYDDLIEAMERERCFRVFVKLAHGSSASGAVAYEWNGTRHRAITTVEMVQEAGETKLYNSRRIRTSYDTSEIRRLIDPLCRHRVHVEQWIPKAADRNRLFDLRVVMIAGDVRHTVVRLSQSPMTNLHLLNDRTALQNLSRPLPAEAWNAAQHTCQQAAALFPGSLYSGIDLLFEPGYRRHHILEINAFGDLLPGWLDRGQTTYEAEIQAVVERATC